MNTKIDETRLARWLEDEMDDTERAAFEAELGGGSEWHDTRTMVRALRRDLAGVIPASEEPPYGEFFNSRIQHAIRETREAAPVRRGFEWGRWWLPAGAAAGMALAFWAGTRTHDGQVMASVPAVSSPAPVATAEPGLYTPERGVDAEWFASKGAAATVIVLDGVEAIPDDTDLFRTAGGGDGGRGTAAVEQPEGAKEARLR